MTGRNALPHSWQSTLQAINDNEAVAAVKDMAGGGEVAWVRRLG